MRHTDSLGALDAFVRAAEARSFTAAGRQLGVSSSAIGKAVARLERRLGVRLLHRSTRSVTLTPEGALFLERCRRIFSEIETAETELAQTQGAPRGRLRVSLPLAGMLMMPTLGAFMHAYPEIELDLDFTDRLVDVIEEGFDAVIRAGEVSDSRLMSRLLGVFRLQLVAAPGYLERRGVPRVPEDLAGHACLQHRFATSGKFEPWPLRGEVALPSTAVANTIEPLIALAEQGLAEQPVDFAVGILSALLTSATFMGVLWTVGGNLTIGFGGQELFISGYLVIAVVLYCVIIGGLMTIIARSFVPTAENKNQVEAEFRAALTRMPNAARASRSSAAEGGARRTRWLAQERDRRMVAHGRAIHAHDVVSHGNFIIASVIPVILCAPKYLSGEMTLGTVMQAAAAFIQVQYAFNWIVDNYPRLAEWAASARRASNLLVALDGLKKIEDSQTGAISRTEGKDAAIRLKDVQVSLSDGTVVVDDANVTVQFRREGAGRGRIRHRQEHLGARDRRAVAVGRRRDRARARRQDVPDPQKPTSRSAPCAAPRLIRVRRKTSTTRNSPRR